MNEWISVKDKTPKDELGKYLVVGEDELGDRVIVVCWCDPENNKWLLCEPYILESENNLDVLIKNVTHWMPLPEPPNE